MKVRCKDYEGELIKLETYTIGMTLGGKFQAILYEIEIALNQKSTITISAVKAEDIEFIKES